MSYLIKDLPVDEKPREKAKKYGFQTLSNVELLSILIRCGSKNCSVKEVAQDILRSVGGLSGLRDIRVSKLSKLYGVGEVKAITLLAAVELGRRLSAPDEKEKIQINESKKVFLYCQSRFALEKQEKLLVLFLDPRNYILEEKVIFQGTADQSFIHPRDIFQEAVLVNAVKIICVHNHPSGNASPSLADELVTKKIYDAGLLLGIPLVDHVIIGKNDYYSFLEHRKGGF